MQFEIWLCESSTLCWPRCREALIGATNPAEAAPGTIRADFAESIAANAVHGSDSDENAAIEGAFYFSQRELA